MDIKSLTHNSTYSDKISILHLSDLHFNKENEYEIKTVLDSLKADIKKLKDNDEIYPYIIAISGDIANEGKKSDYDFALSWLNDLTKIFNVDKDKVFIVPGNHDVNRDELLEFSKVKFDEQKGINKFLKSTGPEKEALFKKLNNFSMFINEFYDEKNPYSDNFYFASSVKVGSYLMGVVGLNSAWFSGERRFGDVVIDEKALIVGEIQVREAYDSVKAADFCLTIMHHPFSWLADLDEGLIKRIAMKNSDIILHGHIHSNSAVEIMTPDSTCVILSAGASFIDKRDKRYSIITIDLSDLSYEILLRLYSEEGKFWAKDTMTYQTGEGVIHGVIKSGVNEKAEYPFSDSHPLIMDFVKFNWRRLAFSEYNKEKILEIRKAFFRKSEINPSLHDIALQTIQFLLKDKLIRSKNELDELFYQSYFIDNQLKKHEKDKIFSYFNDEYFRNQTTGFLTSKEEIVKLKERQFLVKKENEIAKSLKIEIKKEYEDKTKELENRKFEIEKQYNLFKSEIDDYKKFSEEELPKINIFPPHVKDREWYKEVRLKDNPFKSHIGLEAFDENQYEDVIVKTSIYHKFDYQIMELEKSIRRRSFLIYGTNGSGKTTFYKYLENAISIFNPKALTIFIPLEAQKEHELIRNDFYQKFYLKLTQKYYSLSNTPVENEKSTIGDIAILELCTKLFQLGKFDDYIVFIDDLHKHQRYMEEVFEFISGLQIIRAFLHENGINLTLFLTGDLSWVAHADGRKALGGSVDIKEKIPEISVDDAVEMINRRLVIFSEDPNNPIEIKKDYVEKIFKILKARIPIEVTFRDIIEEVEVHWQNYEFESLSLSEILDSNTLSSMFLDFEADHPNIKNMIDEIWEYYENDEGIFNHFGKVIGMLYSQHGISEDSYEFKDNREYFGYLYKVGIIGKFQRKNSFFWALTKNTSKMFDKFKNKYGFNPQEFLPKLYLKDIDKEYVTEESSRLHMILKTGGLYGDNFLKNINESLDGYKKVFKHSTSLQDLVEPDDLINICQKSVLNLMKGTLIVCENIQIKSDSIFEVSDYFIDTWFENSDLTEFIGIYQKKKQKESNLSDTDIKEICRDYFRAMKTTISKLQRFIRYNTVFTLDSNLIYSKDKNILNTLRMNIYKENYLISLEKANSLIEIKLRDIIYIVSSLAYGPNNWMKSLPTEINGRLNKVLINTCSKSNLNNLSIIDLTDIFIKFDDDIEVIFIDLFGEDSFKIFKEKLLLNLELQKNNQEYIKDISKQDILDYLMQMKILVENVDGFYYKLFANQISSIINYQKLRVVDGKICSYEFDDEVINSIKSKLESDGTLELNLNQYIPHPTFVNLNFVDWIMYIYHLKNNLRAIDIGFAPNGNIIIT